MQMQSETADFTSVPPSGELDETYASSLILAVLCKNMTSSIKPEIHNISHCRQRKTEPRPSTGNVCRQFGETWTCGLRYASRQTHKPTDRHTDTLITILYTPAGGEAHISIRLIMIMAYYIIGLYCNETASRTKTCKIYYKSEFNLPYNRRP